jgi:hypothetical protein
VESWEGFAGGRQGRREREREGGVREESQKTFVIYDSNCPAYIVSENRAAIRNGCVPFSE